MIIRPYKYIRKNPQVSNNFFSILSQTREENEKLCRALLPENREATLKGRKLISELVYELGGQDNPVSWQSVQKKYKEKYNEELAGEVFFLIFLISKIYFKIFSVPIVGKNPLPT